MAQNLADAIVEYRMKIAADDKSQHSNENIEAMESIRNTILALYKLDEDEENWTVTSRTAVNWLHKLGDKLREVKKRLYKDGHERDDVLTYRKTIFLPFLEALKPRLLEWDEKGNLLRTPEEIFRVTGQSPCVLVTHAECIYYANNRPTHVWTLKGSMPL